MNSEIKVINSVLKNKDIGVLFAENIDDMFIDYRDVWDSIKKYYADHHAVPDIEVMQEQFPTEIQVIDVKGATEYYVDNLREDFIKSKIEAYLLRGSSALKEMSGNELLNNLQSSFSKLQIYSNKATDLDLMDFEDAEKHYEETRRIVAERGGTPGIPTGVSFFDSAYTTGLAPGDLVIALGWTGRAKSLFTTYIACNAYEKGYHPMIITLEMNGQKVRDRAYTIMGSGLFKNSELALGEIDTESFQMFADSNKGKGQITVVANNGGEEITPNFVQAKINQHKPDLVILDYAQLMSDNDRTGDMTARMRNMSKQFKALAVANKIAIILISSATASNGKEAETPPVIEQVAWSKQLAFDADLAFAVHKHLGTNFVEIVGRKNRNGELFAGVLDWDIDKGIIVERFDIPVSGAF